MAISAVGEWGVWDDFQCQAKRQSVTYRYVTIQLQVLLEVLEF